MPADRTEIDLAVVDTDVFSYIQKRRSRAAPYEEYLRGRVAALSFQTVAEVLQGVYQRPDWTQQTVDSMMAEVRKYLIVPFNMGMVEHWARFRASRLSRGLHLGARDAWIAATARWLEAPLVTNNARDYAGLPELEVISFAPGRAQDP